MWHLVQTQSWPWLEHLKRLEFTSTANRRNCHSMMQKTWHTFTLWQNALCQCQWQHILNTNLVKEQIITPQGCGGSEVWDNGALGKHPSLSCSCLSPLDFFPWLFAFCFCSVHLFHDHPGRDKPSITQPNIYRPINPDICGNEVLWKTGTEPTEGHQRLLDPRPFAHLVNIIRSVDDAVNVRLNHD